MAKPIGLGFLRVAPHCLWHSCLQHMSCLRCKQLMWFWINQMTHTRPPGCSASQRGGDGVWRTQVRVVQCMLAEAVVSVGTNGDYQRVRTHAATSHLHTCSYVTLAQVYMYWIVISTWIMHSWLSSGLKLGHCWGMPGWFYGSLVTASRWDFHWCETWSKQSPLSVTITQHQCSLSLAS